MNLSCTAALGRHERASTRRARARRYAGSAGRIARTATIAMALASVVLLGGCNTMRGFGKDVSKVGDAIEDAATR